MRLELYSNTLPAPAPPLGVGFGVCSAFSEVDRKVSVDCRLAEALTKAGDRKALTDDETDGPVRTIVNARDTRGSLILLFFIFLGFLSRCRLKSSRDKS